MSFLSPPKIDLPPVPAPPPPPPAFGEIQGSKPGRKPMTPTFLGGSALAGAANLGGTTLLGDGSRGSKTFLGQ